MTELKIPKIEVSVKVEKHKKSELHVVESSYQASQLFRKIFDADTFEWVESMVMVCLNRSNKVVGYYKVSQGGMSATTCDPKVIFTIALNCTAVAIMVAHNHPSGNVKPSEADIQHTRRLKLAGDTLDIKVIDHIILSDTSYFSFADEGMI